MKYFYICAVVVFGFLEQLVCKVGCGNGYLAKSYDFCSLTVVGRFFSVKTVVKWNIWKICSMQNGSSHTFILTFRFAFRERERIFWNSYSQMVCAGFIFYMFLSVFGLGRIFFASVCRLVNPPFPLDHIFNFLWLEILSFFTEAEVWKRKRKKGKGRKKVPAQTQ